MLTLSVWHLVLGRLSPIYQGLFAEINRRRELLCGEEEEGERTEQLCSLAKPDTFKSCISIVTS